MNSSQFKIVLILQIVTLFLVGMLYFKPLIVNSGKPLTGTSTKGIPTKSNVKVEYGDNYVYGSSDAQNELIVFTRYNCGFCRDFYNEVFDSLKSNYVNTEKLKIIFMDNVNPNDRQGMLMAKIAEMGKQSNMYEAIQHQLFNGIQPDDSMQVVQRALATGIDEQQLLERLGTTELRESVLIDNNEVDRLNINSTPTFVINGSVIVGFKGYVEFMRNFEKLMNPQDKER
jgi:protein-disulfide isomerase